MLWPRRFGITSLAMAAASPLASLLALSCFALLATAYAAVNSNNLANCVESLVGRASLDVIVLKQIITPPYQDITHINYDDNCLLSGKRLVGALIVACDPLGPPPPSIHVNNILSEDVQCHTDGPCPAGLVVSITEYCG